jgi:tetratricopeptide (TPR) repeat protein
MIDKNNSLENAIDLHIRNKFQEAFDQYIQIINQDKDNYQAFHYLGILLIQVGYKDIGTEYIQKAMALNNEYKLAYENLQIFNNPILGKYKKESEHSIQQESRYQKIDIKNVGNWRFLRMLDFVKVLKAENSNWLTVGDAFGYDSILLKYQ